jgi:hypothetical protein
MIGIWKDSKKQNLQNQTRVKELNSKKQQESNLSNKVKGEKILEKNNKVN